MGWKEDYSVKFFNLIEGKHPEYDFSISEYKGVKFKIKFNCPKHGVVEKWPQDLLRGGKCGECFREKQKEYSYFSKNKWSQEHFIEKCREKFGNKFDYSLVKYENQHKKIKVICSTHGEVLVIPECFLKISPYGCPKCGKEVIGNKIHQRWLNKHNSTKEDYKKYKVKVNYYTEKYYKAYKDIIDPENLRSKNYHLDHIIPVSFGFQHKIPEEIIGCNGNLRIISQKENLTKLNNIYALGNSFLTLAKALIHFYSSMDKKCALSSTHSSGKTTLINELSKDKKFILWDFYTEKTKKLRKELGISLNDKSEIISQYAMLGERAKELCSMSPFFSDRSIYDVLAYTLSSTEIGEEEKKRFKEACLPLMKAYDVIFYVDPEGVELEDNGLRDTNPEYRIKINKIILDLLKEYPPKKLIRLKGLTEERINQIKRVIG